MATKKKAERVDMVEEVEEAIRHEYEREAGKIVTGGVPTEVMRAHAERTAGRGNAFQGSYYGGAHGDLLLRLAIRLVLEHLGQLPKGGEGDESGAV